MIIQFFLGLFSGVFIIFIIHTLSYRSGYLRGYRDGFKNGSPTKEKLEKLTKEVNEKILINYYLGIERGRHLRDKVNRN